MDGVEDDELFGSGMIECDVGLRFSIRHGFQGEVVGFVFPFDVVPSFDSGTFW